MSLLRQVSVSTCLLFAMAGFAQAQAPARFAISADGQEVTDSSTKLVWKRCVEGMSWNGKTCAGKATKLKLVAAKELTKAGAPVAWRLPVKEELLGLMDKKGKKMTLDKASFPATPARLHWALRPESTDNLNHWLVDFSNGHVFGNTRAGSNYVRLVRSAS